MPAPRYTTQAVPDQALDVPFTPAFVHRVRFSSDVFAPANRVLASVVDTEPAHRTRVQAFVDQGLLEHWPDLPARIAGYIESIPGAALAASVRPILGGEEVKNHRTHLDGALQAIHDAGLCRRSCVLAVGGGAVLDAVGLAAALAHRGVRLIRVPTTTLAQADSGVAVKCGINGFGKKNYLGVFAAPWAVINDEGLLDSLSDRDWRAGFAEAVKVALVKDAGLFADIESRADRIALRDPALSIDIIRRSAIHHLRHITEGGDAFEVAQARPLDFGHWAAHRLESLSGYTLRHGEAVAIGIAIDTAYARLARRISPLDASRITDALLRLGFTLHHPLLRRTDDVMAGIDEFREHLGGRLTIAALSAIGRSADIHAIDRTMMSDAVLSVAEMSLTRSAHPLDLAVP